MPLETTLTDSTARLRQGRFSSGCHAEPVEASQLFTTKTPRPQRTRTNREYLREMCEALPGGWLVATNLNNILKKPSPRDATRRTPVANVIKLAAEIAGLSFGKDVVVEF